MPKKYSLLLGKNICFKYMLSHCCEFGPHGYDFSDNLMCLYDSILKFRGEDCDIVGSHFWGYVTLLIILVGRTFFMLKTRLRKECSLGLVGDTDPRVRFRTFECLSSLPAYRLAKRKKGNDKRGGLVLPFCEMRRRHFGEWALSQASAMFNRAWPRMWLYIPFDPFEGYFGDGSRGKGSPLAVVAIYFIPAYVMGFYPFGGARL